MSTHALELRAATAELDQLMGAELLARPSDPLGDPGAGGRRDPSPMWDYWYEAIGVAERRQLLAFTGPGGIALDQLAGELFCSVDTALGVWREACQAVRTARRHARTAARTVAEELADPTSDTYAAEWEEWDAERMRASALAIYGPQELAKDLSVQVGTVHQWRKRSKLPPADLVISGVPLWHRETLEVAGILPA